MSASRKQEAMSVAACVLEPMASTAELSASANMELWPLRSVLLAVEDVERS